MPLIRERRLRGYSRSSLDPRRSLHHELDQHPEFPVAPHRPELRRDAGELFPLVSRQPTTDKKTAVFAGGCYWGAEAIYDHVKGVKSAVSGFAVGGDPPPSVQLRPGHTGYAESVRVTYDPSQISYDQYSSSSSPWYMTPLSWTARGLTWDRNTGQRFSTRMKSNIRRPSPISPTWIRPRRFRARS